VYNANSVDNVACGSEVNMGRSWTSQPPGLVAIRLNVTPETRLKLSELAGRAGVPMAQFVRQLVEAVCSGETVHADGLVAQSRAEKLTQFSSSAAKADTPDAPKRPRGRPRKNTGEVEETKGK
jgi:hypothetical protein